MAKIAAIERDFIARILLYISDKLTVGHDEFCANPEKKCPIKKLSCSPKVTQFVKNFDHYLFQMPVKLFDFSIDLLNETAACKPLMDCDFAYYDDLMEKYPELDIDLGFLFGDGDEDDEQFPFDILF